MKDYTDPELMNEFNRLISEDKKEVIKSLIKNICHEYVNESMGVILDIPLTPLQISIWYGISQDAVYKWKQRGIVPFYDIKGKSFVKLRDVVKFMIDERYRH